MFSIALIFSPQDCQHFRPIVRLPEKRYPFGNFSKYLKNGVFLVRERSSLSISGLHRLSSPSGIEHLWSDVLGNSAVICNHLTVFQNTPEAIHSAYSIGCSLYRLSNLSFFRCCFKHLSFNKTMRSSLVVVNPRTLRSTDVNHVILSGDDQLYCSVQLERRISQFGKWT